MNESEILDCLRQLCCEAANEACESSEDSYEATWCFWSLLAMRHRQTNPSYFLSTQYFFYLERSRFFRLLAIGEPSYAGIALEV